jgi:hypothetical protein
VNLLWTSGWDSTYRLLDLAIVAGRRVQPYYVVDASRTSSSVELSTQDKIKAALRARFPAAAKLIAPTITILDTEIPPIPEITDRFERLRERSPIGIQYDYLARAAKHWKLDDLELSVHVDDKLFQHLDGQVEKVDGIYRLRSDAPADVQILKLFRFPILMLAKTDMEAAAGRNGFADLMELTWFCFRPIRGKACGICNPCQYTIVEGMGRRVPLEGRIRRRVWNALRSARTRLRGH